MKLVCKAFANSKFAVIGKELVANKDGIIEIEDKQEMVSSIVMLKSVGFEEFKEEPKKSKDSPKEESKEELKEEIKEEPKKRYNRKQP